MINSHIKSNRNTLLLIAVLMGLFILGFLPVWKKLVQTWLNSEDFSHGFFIVPICGYIIWQKRSLLTEFSNSSSWGRAVPAIFALLLYIFAHFAEIATLESFSMVLFLAGMIALFYGFGMLKKLAFPLAFLLFMIPIPAQIYSKLTIPLQLFVSKVSVWFTANLGIPIYRDGNVIHLPGRTMQVLQACSGLRSMVSILPLGAILGYFTLQSNRPRWVLFFSGIPVAIIVNIARVVLLVMAFYFVNLDLTTGILHTVLGVLVFGLALVIILITKEMLSKWDRSCVKK